MDPVQSKKESYLLIEAGKGRRQFCKDLWNYRELFLFLSWRDILVRYKQTVLGVLWSMLRPLLTIIIFTLIFGRLAKLPSQGVPYAILVFAAMLPWQLFASALSESSNSLLGNAHLISKIYFPRLIIPVSSIMVSLLDLLISLALLLVPLSARQPIPFRFFLSLSGPAAGPGVRVLVFSFERQIPRLPPHHRGYHSIRTVSVAGRLQQ
jgi:lipopolysaccharide transport system permease protein